MLGTNSEVVGTGAGIAEELHGGWGGDEKKLMALRVNAEKFKRVSNKVLFSRKKKLLEMVEDEKQGLWRGQCASVRILTRGAWVHST